MTTILKHDDKANAIIEIGMKILWSKGYNATSVNDIVKAADIPKGSFYFYFDSKEDFAIKSIDRYFSQMFIPAMEILRDKSVSPKQRLLNFHEFRYNVLKNEMDCKMGCLASNIGNEMAEHNENIRIAIMLKEEIAVSAITEVVQEAQDCGEIDNTISAKALTTFIEDAGKGAMISMKEAKNSYPIDNFMDMIKNVLLK